MGSLVPGWDGAGGVPPRELQEFNEVEEQAQGGYFARLEQSKSLKRTSLDPGAAMPLQPIPSLQRASSLQQGPPRAHPLSSSLGATSMMARYQPAAGSPHASHPASAGASHGSAHLASVLSPRKYQPTTDWESEFKSLSSKGVPHWWAHLDSGALNRSAAAEAEAAAAAATSPKDLRGSFKLDVPTGINLH